MITNGSYPPSSFLAPLPYFLDLSALYTIMNSKAGKEPSPPTILRIFRTFFTLSFPFGAPPHFPHSPQHLTLSDSHSFAGSIGGLIKLNHTSTWTVPRTTPLLQHSTRSALLNLPLLQALDFLHTQLLAGLCVAAPKRGLIKRDNIHDPTRRHPPPNFGRLTPPKEAFQHFQPPKFRCWIGKRISPNMSLITLKCDSSPWANRFHSAGFTAGNILQLVFPTVPLPPSDPTLSPQAVPPYSLPEHSAFAFAIYLTSVSSSGRVGEEPSSAFNDRSPAYVKELSGIVLPILLRYHLFSKDGNANFQGAPLGHLKLHHMMAPDASTLLEIPQLPPLLHSQSFYGAVSAIRSFFAKITSVPFYRTPKTLGWPTKDAALAPLSHQDQTSPSFSNLFHILQLLPNFFPPEVRGLISDFKIEESTGLSFFYSYDAFTHLKQLGIRPGTASTTMAHPYDWPLVWDLNGFTCILEPRSFLAPLLSTHSALLSLLLDLGSHFTRALIASLLAPNGHFPGLLLATLTGIQAGHTTLCVQGIFGSGKTYSAALLLVVLSSILNVNCVLTAEPNLPLATAIEIIDTLLQDASNNIRSQYARCLANQVKSSSPLDCAPEDRSQLLRHDSTLRCLLITQGSLLRDLCREHPAFQSFLTSCSIAINDEAQQGGQAGSTILASFLDRRCLQLLIGDKEQTRSGTGGEPTKESSSRNLP